MEVLINEIVINERPENVFNWCTQIDRYPDIFSNCISVKKTELRSDEIIMELNVTDVFGESTIRSHRRYYYDNHRIEFALITLPEKLLEMSGYWNIDNDGRNSILQIIHLFTLADLKYSSSKSVTRKNIYMTTQRVIEEIKKWVEKNSREAIHDRYKAVQKF